jgi:hypothetical protein
MKKIAFLFFISIAIFACEKEIIIDTELLESKLAVSAFISTDSAITVYVYQSQPLNGFNESKTKKNAKVTLRFDNQQFDLGLGSFEQNNYQGGSDTLYYFTTPNLRGIAGKTYHLEVSCPGFETVTAETTIPIPVEIISVDTMSMFVQEGNYTSLRQYYNLRFKDPGHEANYYRLLRKERGGKWRNYYVNSDTIRYFSLYEDMVNSYFGSNDPVYGDESNNADSYIFGGAWNSFGVFNDELINGKDYQLNVYKSLTYWGDNDQREEEVRNNMNTRIGNFEKTTMYLQSISKDMFLYLKSVDLQSYNDGEPFMEPVPVYNNINNGYGIFGSYSSTSFDVSWGEYPKEGIEYLTYTEAWQRYMEMNPDLFN